MREVQRRQQEFCQPRIEDIKLFLDSRDDIPPVLQGVQDLYSDPKFREPVFKLLNETILPHADRNQGRPGMDLWSILVLGIVKQAKRLDFDALHELANHHDVLRLFLGHTDIWSKHRYSLKTLQQNINRLTPDLLRKISELAVKCGHAIMGISPHEALRAAGDSFVALCDVHWPTDISLLRDAVRALILGTRRWGEEHGVSGIREWKDNREKIKKLFHLVRKGKCENHDHVKSYLAACKTRVDALTKVVEALKAARAAEWKIRKLEHFIGCARILMDQVERRILKGEKIPHCEKIFSVFEPHTRWIAKGKAGHIAELGVPVHILADQNGFILVAMIGWEGVDKDFAVPLVEEAQKMHPQLDAASFDRGYHSPENQAALDRLVECNAMQKKGKMNEAERERQSDPEFQMMARSHSRIESNINNLEQRGMDRVLSYGPDGFERMVFLSVLALNVHLLGLRRRERFREERKREAGRKRRGTKAA